LKQAYNKLSTLKKNSKEINYCLSQLSPEESKVEFEQLNSDDSPQRNHCVDEEIDSIVTLPQASDDSIDSPSTLEKKKLMTLPPPIANTEAIEEPVKRSPTINKDIDRDLKLLVKRRFK